MSRYQLQELLGCGAMGEVWRGTRMLAGGRSQIVAIKFVRKRWRGDREALERFLLEGRVCIDLHHSNLVEVFDLCEIGGRPAIVMEHVRGASLAMLSRAYQLPMNAIRIIARDALAGLRYAHGRDVLHRDLSPGNIMVDVDGRTRILDFGMARAIREPETVGNLKGTLPYLAPEVLQHQQWSRSSDLYSLAAVLYRLLTGKPPYARDTLAGLLDAMRSDTIEPLPAVVPSDLRQFIDTALTERSIRTDERLTATADAIAPLSQEAERQTRALLGALVTGAVDEIRALESATTIALRQTRGPRSASVRVGADSQVSSGVRTTLVRSFLVASATAVALALGVGDVQQNRAAPTHQPAPVPIVEPLAPTLGPAEQAQKPPPPAPTEVESPSPEAAKLTTEPDPQHSRPKPRTLRGAFFQE